VASVGEVVVAFLRRVEGEDATDGVPETVDGAIVGFAGKAFCLREACPYGGPDPAAWQPAYHSSRSNEAGNALIALTPNRAAAERHDNPASTSATIRSRRSCDSDRAA
jgi:hypothetical protein